MRIVLALLVFTCCLAMSNGALKFLKSKLTGAPLIYPVARYRTLKYLSSPVVVSEFLPANYAHPVFVSTYSVSSPSVATYAVPIQTHSIPYAYQSTYVAPVDVYSRPLQVAQETVYTEPVLSYDRTLSSAVEEHYSV